jgi:hypothetical protein
MGINKMSNGDQDLKANRRIDTCAMISVVSNEIVEGNLFRETVGSSLGSNRGKVYSHGEIFTRFEGSMMTAQRMAFRVQFFISNQDQSLRFSVSCSMLPDSSDSKITNNLNREATRNAKWKKIESGRVWQPENQLSQQLTPFHENLVTSLFKDKSRR